MSISPENQKKTRKVAIITVNWNGWQDTLECLDSLTKITYPNYETIVVDNGSTNDSVERLKTKKQELEKKNETFTLIENKENLGFAGGNNVAIKRALENSADYVLLLNNDTLVSPDFLDKLVETGESNAQYGVLGPKIYYATEKDRIWFGGGYFSWLGGGRHLEYEKIDSAHVEEETKETDYITGCSVLIKREVLEKIGLLNDDFFIYYEDTEYSLRARKNGWKVIYVPRAHIWHKISRSTKPETNANVFYYHIRNALLLSRLHAPVYILPGIYLWSVLCYSKQIIKPLFAPSKREIAKMIMRGIEDFYGGKFGIYKSK